MRLDMTTFLDDIHPIEARDDPVNEPQSEVPAASVASKVPVAAKLGAAALLVAALALAAVYGIGGLGGNDGNTAKCAGTLDAAARLKPLAVGDVAAFTPAETRRDLSALAFGTGTGTGPTTLAAWRGRVVLLNLWATWCVPCRKEMPALDRLQAKLGSPDFEVVALNLDTRDPERPKKFLADIEVKTLAWYADPSLAAMKALQKLGLVTGLPTTILIDRQGCELGAMAGPAEWDRADAAALIGAALKSR
jgi:thiol-disulfide isomerase/thioredoxin